MISELLEQLFPWKRSVSSRVEAKQRLKLVIAQDRSGLSPDALESMRQEILAVVARYVDIDADESEFSLESDRQMTALIANLPIKRVKEKVQPETSPEQSDAQPSPEPPAPPELTDTQASQEVKQESQESESLPADSSLPESDSFASESE